MNTDALYIVKNDFFLSQRTILLNCLYALDHYLVESNGLLGNAIKRVEAKFFSKSFHLQKILHPCIL